MFGQHYTGDPDVDKTYFYRQKNNTTIRTRWKLSNKQQPVNNSKLHNKHSAVSIKLPQIWESNPLAWFVISEAQFSNANIKLDTTKYNYVVSSLTNVLASKIIHIITNPPLNDNIKKAICNLLEPSEEHSKTIS